MSKRMMPTNPYPVVAVWRHKRTRKLHAAQIELNPPQTADEAYKNLDRLNQILSLSTSLQKQGYVLEYRTPQEVSDERASAGSVPAPQRQAGA